RSCCRPSSASMPPPSPRRSSSRRPRWASASCAPRRRSARPASRCACAATHAELRARRDTVLDAIYAAYAEGWSDPAGTDAHRRNLADEAIWLGRLVASLLPDEPEALGLLSLMLHTHARRAARRD